MKEILNKLIKMRDEILLEKPEGSIKLFALIERTDLENKWDVLFSADWLEKTSSEKDLVYLIEKLKSTFENNLDFLSKIVVATPKEIFIKKLARAILQRNDQELESIEKLQVEPNLTIRNIIVIDINFDDVDLQEIGVEEGPIAVKEISDF